MKCSACGKAITNVYKLDGKSYGKSCYKKELALRYKIFEDAKNLEYSKKVFSAMEIYKNKKSNSFHDSIMAQWEDCKKITAKQLSCILKSFTLMEDISFYEMRFNLTEDEKTKEQISNLYIKAINNNNKWADVLENVNLVEIVTYKVSSRRKSEYSEGFIIASFNHPIYNEHYITSIKFLSDIEEEVEDGETIILKVFRV